MSTKVSEMCWPSTRREEKRTEHKPQECKLVPNSEVLVGKPRQYPSGAKVNGNCANKAAEQCRKTKLIWRITAQDKALGRVVRMYAGTRIHHVAELDVPHSAWRTS